MYIEFISFISTRMKKFDRRGVWREVYCVFIFSKQCFSYIFYWIKMEMGKIVPNIYCLIQINNHIYSIN